MCCGYSIKSCEGASADWECGCWVAVCVVAEFGGYGGTISGKGEGGGLNIWDGLGD
jgi:hypothetical protein